MTDLSKLQSPYYDEDGITIYHADCREILPHLPKVDLVLTDPPYGHNNNNNNDMIANWEAIYGGKNKPRAVDPSEYRPIANDGPEANDLFRWAVGEYAKLLKPGCCCCCCGGGGGGSGGGGGASPKKFCCCCCCS